LVVLARAERFDQLRVLVRDVRPRRWLAVGGGAAETDVLALAFALISDTWQSPELLGHGVARSGTITTGPGGERELATWLGEAAVSPAVIARVAAASGELMSNACRVARASEVEVRVASERGRVLVSVRDPCGGLEQLMVVRALARGFGSGDARPSTGAGLGLYYVLGLCELLSVRTAPGRVTEVAAWFAPRREFVRGLYVGGLDAITTE
jgi:anti-sigma regulatory factor (Ser/Thr protein kinase)